MCAEAGVQHLAMKPIVPIDDEGHNAIQSGRLEPADVLRPLLESVAESPVRSVVYLDIILDFPVTDGLRRMAGEVLGHAIRPGSGSL